MFLNIFGHNPLRSSLSSIVGKQGVYLFYGPPSVGKRTIAQELATYFLCKDKKDEGCVCGSCQSISAGHPDFLCVGQDGKLKVGDVDRVIEFASFSPLVSKTKVIIIDGVDRASPEAANRLLKILEESSYTFFLISSNNYSILPTVISRCLKIKFGPLSQEDLANVLWKKFGFDLPKARVIGWLGAGSSVDVFSNAGLYLKYRDMSFELLGLSDLLDALDFIEKVDSKELTIFVDILIMTLTDILLSKKGIEDIVNSDRRDDVLKIAKVFSEKGLILSLSFLSQVKKDAQLNVNLGLIFKTTLIKIFPMLRGA
jgi:DNA polymerase-3 subunit delta'